ncbi:MAG: hypothetical protein WCY43_01220 [Patescibacteria group bacterium]|nr:hypothetical protein [Patescibacteria group bacterium]
MSNKENKTTETAEDKEFRKKATEAGFSEVNTKEEIKKIEVRLKRLDRGGVEQFKGEKEVLVERLKKYGVEYVSKKAKGSVEKINKLAEEPEEKKIAEGGKEKIEEVKESLENEFEGNKSKENFAEDFETITVKRSNGSIEKDWKLMGIQDSMATVMKKNDSGEILRKFIPVKELELFNNKKYSEEEKELVNSEKNEEVLNKESSSEEVENKQEVEISKMLKKELESLGINDEKLKGEAYKKFNELSSGSKLLVLKNLKGIILEEFTEESRSEANSSVGEVKGLFSKIRKSFKENRLANKSREEKLKELNKKGINENHEGKLNSLSEIISTLEIDVSEKDGKTEVSLLKTKEGMNEDQKKAIDELNLAANEFLSIPKEMAYESASKTDQKKYEDARNKYLESRTKIVETLGASKENLSNLNKADLQLRMVRDFSNDSVLSEEWKQAVKNPGFFKKIISSMSSKEKAAYTASGYAVRSITGALSLSALAIPLVMGIGALRSNKRAKEKIKTQDKKAVYKEKKESPLALKRKNIKKQMDKLVPAEFLLEPDAWMKSKDANQEDVKKYLDLKIEFLKLDEKLTQENIEKLNIASAESLVDKLESLSEKVKNEYLTESSKEKPDYNKLKELTESLRLRMMFTREKVSKELVNFGSNEKKALNYLDLQRSLDEAELILAGEEINEVLFSLEESNKNQLARMDRVGVDGKFIAGKKLLDKILDRHAEDLSRERKNYIIKKTIYGALTAGAFAGVGALIREGQDLLSNIDTSDFEQGLTNNEDFEKAVMSGFSAINEANEFSAVDSVGMANSVNGVEANNFDFENSFIKENVLESNLGSVESYVEVDSGIGESLSLAGVDVENMSPKAIESLEKMGNVNKVVTLEKGNGVSKIFGGHMNNEYKVNFVDAETGEITEAAAFSKTVHPGDQVMLGEDGEVYVVCKSGVKNNPLYGAVKENINEGGVVREKIEPIKPIDMSKYELGLDENGKMNFVKNNIVENQVAGGNIVGSEVEGEIANANPLEDWDVSLENGTLINDDGATLVGTNEIPNFSNDKVASVELDGDKYIIKMKDGSSVVFNEMPAGEEVEGVELPKIYQFQEIIPANNPVQDDQLGNILVGDQGGVYVTPESASNANEMISGNLNSNLLENFSEHGVNYPNKTISVDNNIIDFKTSSFGLNKISNIAPEYGGGGGQPVYFKVVYDNGAMETFKPELNTAGEMTYVKAGDGLVDVSSDVEGELGAVVEGGLDLGENNLNSLAERYEWASYLKAGGWENVKIEDEGKSIIIDNYKVKFPDYVKDINEIKLINPLVQEDGSIKFEIQYANGPIRSIDDSFVTVLEEITPAVENASENLASVRDVFSSPTKIKEALGDFSEKIRAISTDNDGNFALKMKDGKVIDISVSEDVIEVGALKTEYVNIEDGKISSEKLKEAVVKHLENMTR